MNLMDYFSLFKKYGKVHHALVLFFAFVVIVINIISIYNSADFTSENSAWIAIMMVVISAVFSNLKKQANTAQSKDTLNNIKEESTIVAPKRNFWNYFALIFFVINIILLILLFLYVKNYRGDGRGIGFGGLIIHFSMILSSIPFVILALFNKGKTFNNITAAFFLLPPIFFTLIIKLAKYFN